MNVTFFFTSRDALERTRDRLVRIGFDSDQLKVSDGSWPRLTIKVPVPELLGVVALLGTIDSGDSRGRPCLWDHAPVPTSTAKAAPPSSEDSVASRRRSTHEIHWEPLDRATPLDWGPSVSRATSMDWGPSASANEELPPE